MKVLAIEIMSNAAGMLLIEGNKTAYEVVNLGKPLAVPKNDTSIQKMIDFQAEFAAFLKRNNTDSVVLCEGGNDSKKMRVRMEFAVLCECEKAGVTYQTYPTGSCTRIINSSYQKESGRVFTDDLAKFSLPKYMGKALAAGWRFLA